MRQLHIGTIGWSYNFWKGTFYPQKTVSKDFLAFYSSRFDTVEVDNTFYRIPPSQAVSNWKNQTPKGFLFSLKFPRVITHIKMLKDCKAETQLFLERANLLGQKLGPLLLQFPPNFGVEHLPDLGDFLNELPEQNRYVVEVRDEGLLKEEFYTLLRDRKAALAWVDSPTMLTMEQVTTDFLYVRWEGDRKKVNGTLGKKEADQSESLRVWAEKIKPYLSGDMQIYGYFGKYYSGFPPSDISLLHEFLQTNL
jgi:uncharacterized protein YecE (DUF72 family)